MITRKVMALVLGTVVVTAAGYASASPAPSRATDTGLYQELIQAAMARTDIPVTYDGAYRAIEYPGGDVPNTIGVCTDLIIRAYRAVGTDLQLQVHEDMTTNFSAYPQRWELSGPDPNIDHRRVPNLKTYFRRSGAALPVSHNPEDYRPGDLITWTLPNNRPHIGLVTEQRSDDGARWLIVHNIGHGPQLGDILFKYRITGHYRYPGG